MDLCFKISNNLICRSIIQIDQSISKNMKKDILHVCIWIRSLKDLFLQQTELLLKVKNSW